MKFCNYNYINYIISHALLPSLPPLPRCDLDSACKVKRHGTCHISWKVTEHVPHHAGVGSGWFGQRHFISFYPMLHAAARLVAQWLSEHIMFAYLKQLGTMLTMMLHAFGIFSHIGKPGCRELSCMSSPHCGSTSPVNSSGCEPRRCKLGDDQHNTDYRHRQYINIQLYILHHNLHYLYNRSIHRQNIMKCEYMMIYECTVCVERLASWRTLDTFQTRDQSFLDGDHPARQLLNPALQSKGMWPW